MTRRPDADYRITSVAAIVLRAPADDRELVKWERGWGRYFLLRVEAASGLVGFGIAETQADVARAIVEAEPEQSFGEGEAATLGGLRSLVVGESAAALEALWLRMYRGTLLYGRRGAALQAISALDMACTDLFAHSLGVGVAELLGGRVRDRIPAYASAVLPDTREAVDALVDSVVASGFGALKVGWGAFSKDAFDLLSLVHAVRERAPAGVRLIFDIGFERRRGRSELLALIRELETLEPLWIEEPCDPDDLEGYRFVCSRANVPIAAGEACSTVHDFAQLLDAGIEIVQPDLSRCGGFTVARKVAHLAEARNRVVIPHAWQNDLLVAATAQFCAALPHDTFVEFSVARGPLREICEPATTLEDGAVRVPSAPGIGVTPSEAVLRRYRETR